MKVASCSFLFLSIRPINCCSMVKVFCSGYRITRHLHLHFQKVRFYFNTYFRGLTQNLWQNPLIQKAFYYSGSFLTKIHSGAPESHFVLVLTMAANFGLWRKLSADFSGFKNWDDLKIVKHPTRLKLDKLIQTLSFLQILFLGP